MKGVIFDIKEMAVHDGPGIRTTVFLKGCPLRCKWCHNPEGLTSDPQLMFKQARCVKCGRCMTKCGHPECQPFGRCIHMCPQNCLEISGRTVEAKELAKELKENAEILGDSFGGFTFSGGEPLFQPKFLIELINELKGCNLCIETSAYAPSEVFREVIKRLDYVIMDIKLADTERHKKFTGVGNEAILSNFEFLKKSGKPYLIRTPLIPNITDAQDNLDAIKQLIGTSDWEQLPYNKMAGAKYKMLGMSYELNPDK